MNPLLKYLAMQFKMDIRERGTLLTFYLLPLSFFAVMGAVFSSINPMAKETLTSSMTIFAVTMGAVLGLPVPIVKMRKSGVLRAFRVNGIPNHEVLLVQAISAFLHLLLVSIIILLTAPLVFGAGVPKSYLGYIIIVLSIIFTSIAVGLLIGVTVNDQSFATMLAQGVFLPSLLLSGIMFPATMLPKPFILIGRIFPATQAMISFNSLAFNLKTCYSGALALVIIVFIGLVTIGIAFWKFEKIGKEQ
jgi:ABC-2 type transport system permease protein